MGAQLRVVLDSGAEVVSPDQAEASVALAGGLVATAPVGCSVAVIVPAGGLVDDPGLDEIRALSRKGSTLAALWRRGIAAGAGRGLIHAPTLFAPLVAHDRVHDNDQTVVTLWDLCAWESPSEFPTARIAWQQAMLKRAVRHADAVVVPAHAMAARLAEIAPLGDRIRVIAGAAPAELGAPADAAVRAEGSDDYVVLTGEAGTLAAGFAAASAQGLRVVVLDAPEGAEPRLRESAAQEGLDEHRVQVRGRLTLADRAAVLAGARALIATDQAAAWPWRVVEAMNLGVPIVAAASDTHRDVIADGGLLVRAPELAEALEAAVGADAARLRVLAGDRSRAFSWASAAERVWALHADL